MNVPRAGVTDVPIFGSEGQRSGSGLSSSCTALDGRPHDMLALGPHVSIVAPDPSRPASSWTQPDPTHREAQLCDLRQGCCRVKVSYVDSFQFIAATTNKRDSDSAYCYAFLRNVVCLSSLCHIRESCLNCSTYLYAIWQVHFGVGSHIVLDGGPWPPGEGICGGRTVSRNKTNGVHTYVATWRIQTSTAVGLDLGERLRLLPNYLVIINISVCLPALWRQQRHASNSRTRRHSAAIL